MYEFIKGEIVELTPAYAVVEAAGVGYYLVISLRTYSELGKSGVVKIYTHYAVREDARILYGFADKTERELFRLLISVSGVGGNTARMILSTYAPKELTNIISSENAALLKNVKGLGLKTSQKIIVELRDKITGAFAASGIPVEAPGAGDGIYEEAMAALSMLGFVRSASDKTVRGILKENPSATVEEVIRMSLKKL